MRLGENSHKRPQGSHKIHYIKKYRIKFKQFLNPYCKINIQTDKTNNQCYARIYLDYGISHMRSTAIVRISVIEVTGDRHADRCDG